MAWIDITRPISPEEVAAIDAGMDKYAVLVFHGQDLISVSSAAVIENASSGSEGDDVRLR